MLNEPPNVMQAGDGAPEQLKPLLEKLNLDIKEGRPPHPLEAVIDSLEYPQHVLETPKPQHYRVTNAACLPRL